MKKQVVKIIDVKASGLSVNAAILTLVFLVGASFGFAVSKQASRSVNLNLIAYVENFLLTIKSGGFKSLSAWGIGRELFSWPLLVIFMGFTPLGIVSIPIMFATRGFSMAFAIGVLGHLYGLPGLALASVLVGVVGTVILPVFFVLGMEHFMLSQELVRQSLGYSKQSSGLNGKYLLKCLICFVVLASCIMLELFAVPTLLSSVMLLF